MLGYQEGRAGILSSGDQVIKRGGLGSYTEDQVIKRGWL